MKPENTPFCLQQKCFILNENWWEERKEQKSCEQSLCTLSATESRESPWRYKKIRDIFCIMHSLLVVAAEILGAVFLPKKVLYDKSDLLALLTKSKIVWHWQKKAGAVPQRSVTDELRCTCVMQCLSCVLTNVTGHSHQFGVKKACCHFVFTCNNSLCWCKPNVFSDKQTCPSFQGWMGTSGLTVELSPEYIPVYLDITDDIGVIRKGK